MPRTIASCTPFGSVYPSSAGQSNGSRGGGIRFAPKIAHGFSLKDLALSSAISSTRNDFRACSLVVTENRNPLRLGDENHGGRQGVWACRRYAARHHGSIVCQLDAGS